jgi:hypothetical protein
LRQAFRSIFIPSPLPLGVRRNFAPLAESKENVVYLYAAMPVFNVITATPFGLKLETYFRMANIPYEFRLCQNVKQSPKNKMPYIFYNDEWLGDTTLIIEKLKKNKCQH